MPHKRKKRTLKQIHAQIKRAHTLLDKVPAWKTNDQTKLLHRIRRLEEEQYNLLGIPWIGSGVQ
jgi:hypothetical protein